MTTPPRTPRPLLRRLLPWLLTLAIAAAVLQVPISGFVARPGPVFSLADRIEVEAAVPEPLDGDYLFTTVEVQGATIGSGLVATVDPGAQLISRDALLGGRSQDDFIAEQEAAFAHAEAVAVVLALELVDSDLSADAIRITGDGVGGPSAGLLITLAIADLVSPVDVAAGRLIAGTGAVDAEGRVRPVGGIGDKIAAAERAGADVFVLPVEQLPAAERTGTRMELLGAGTAREALDLLTG